jgi:hypothetical protein
VENDRERRTKQFSLSAIKFTAPLPRTRDFANKIRTVQKEASETVYWIELLIESGIASDVHARDCIGNLQIAGDLHLHREKAEAMIPRFLLPTSSFLLPTFTDA